MSKLGRLLGQAINERESIRTEQVRRDLISNEFILVQYRVKLVKTYFKLDYRAINNAFILGHSTNGILGTAAGNVLGTAVMGSWVTVEEDNSTEKVTNSCLNELAKWFNGESASIPTHVGIGTDSSSYSESQTDLGSEVQSRAEVSVDTSSSKTIQYEAVFTDVSQSDVTEVGLFTASSGGIMYFRKVHSSIDMSIANQYRYTFKLEVADASPGYTVVVDEGLNVIRDWIGTGSGTPPSHTEWNDATSTPTSSHTASTWDSGGSNEQRNAFAAQSRTRNIVTFETLLTTSQLNGVDVAKSGNFNASTNGTLFGEVRYGLIEKNNLFQVYEIDKYIFTNV